MHQGRPAPPPNRIDLDDAARLLEAVSQPDPDGESTNAPPGYAITGRLGRGAAGEVFLANHLGSDRPVALKLMHRTVADAAATRRVWRELDLLQHLRLKHIPLVVDYGIFNGHPFIATEFVEGRTLDKHFGTPAQADPTSRRKRTELLAKICDAVGEFHDAGSIHRDLKPANIMITPQGEPVILDLGMASPISPNDAEALTADGATIGTPAYMSPEQARGDRPRAGIRSDVYSLGATAFRVLTGHTPHDLDGISLYEAIRRVGSLPPRNPRDLDQTIPRPLAAVLAKACAQMPADRYASAPELAADLRRWINNQPVDAQHPGPWVRATRWLAAHPVAATTAICGTILSTTAAGVLGFLAYLDHAALRPVNIDHNSSMTEIWTVSATGRRIDTVYSSTDGQSASVTIFNTPETELGWAIALSAPDRHDEHDPHVFRLSALDPADPVNILWTLEQPGHYPPLRYPAYTSPANQQTHYYSGIEATPADVFSQIPGDEIITIVRGAPSFPSVLRVHSAEGEQLYRVWVPGHQSIFWLESRRVIVVAGANNRLETPARSEADYKAGDPPGDQAHTVALVKPVLHQINDRWLTHRIPGSQTNAEDCSVLVQPASHEPGYAQAEGPIPKLEFRNVTRPHSYPKADHMRLHLEGLLNPGSEVVGRCHLILDDRLSLRDSVFYDPLVTEPVFREFLSLWKGPRLRLSPCPSFDPNP